MKKTVLLTMSIAAALAAIVAGSEIFARDVGMLRVPNGLAFAEFQGYETWQIISISQNGPLVAAILGNPPMIAAYKSGIPDNGKPFPDGAKMAKIHWNPKTNATAPGQPLVPDTLHDIDFMVKDGRRFADSGGWGYAEFEYVAASDSFRPGTTSDEPPQGNDAKCGFVCHTVRQDRDYVFTTFPKR